MQLSMTNRKEIILATIHNYTIALRSAAPGLSDRECYHRLVDACHLSGHAILEKRNDSRYIVGNLEVGGVLQRFFTLFRNEQTGKIDCDLSHSMTCEEVEDQEFYMLLFKVIIASSAMVLSDAISGAKPGEGSLSVAARQRAVMLTANQS